MKYGAVEWWAPQASTNLSGLSTKGPQTEPGGGYRSDSRSGREAVLAVRGRAPVGTHLVKQKGLRRRRLFPLLVQSLARR